MHRIEEVVPKDNFMIEAIFFGGEVMQYDVKRLFGTFPQFETLIDDEELFLNVRIDAGGYGISWNDSLDLDAETIWNDGILIETRKETDINHLLAYQLVQAREKCNMTQRQLADKTGIYQADISKIERGMGNPSLATIKRLADGLNMAVQIDFLTKE